MSMSVMLLYFSKGKEKRSQNGDGKVKEAPKDNMISFSSIALLSNMCFGPGLNWENFCPQMEHTMLGQITIF